MSQSLPTDPHELESLAEKVRKFLRLSRPIPIVIIEKREPEGREDWKTSRHRAALAQIESCCLVPSDACTLAEGLAPFGVSYLNYVDFDRDLVVPTNAGDLVPTHFGGPREYRPLPPGGIRVSSADSSWPWGHVASVAKVNLEACREDAAALSRRLENLRKAPVCVSQDNWDEPSEWDFRTELHRVFADETDLKHRFRDLGYVLSIQAFTLAGTDEASRAAARREIDAELLPLLTREAEKACAKPGRSELIVVALGGGPQAIARAMLDSIYDEARRQHEENMFVRDQNTLALAEEILPGITVLSASSDHEDSQLIVETASTNKADGAFEHPEATNGDLNAFFRDGDAWRVRFEGKDLPALPSLQGLERIHRLLRSPGVDVTAVELDSPGRAEYLGSDDVMDFAASQELGRRAHELSEDIREAKRSGDVEAEDHARIEIEKLRESFESAHDKKGRPRKLVSEADAARHRVGSSIDTALAKIRERNLALFEHLSKAIIGRRARKVRYSPKVPVVWRLDP